MPTTLTTNYLLPCYQSAFNSVFISFIEREISKQSPLLKTALSEDSSGDPGKAAGSIEQAIGPKGDRLKREYVECKLECPVTREDVMKGDFSGLIKTIKVQAKQQASIIYPHLYNSLIDQGVITDFGDLSGIKGSELIDKIIDNIEAMDIAFRPVFSDRNRHAFTIQIDTLVRSKSTGVYDPNRHPCQEDSRVTG